jgi:transcriptional/translational regulatory protein YebC/TACO1
MVTTLTDNKNRTASNIRHIFTKYGGNMGESGSVGFIFEKKGLLFLSLDKYDAAQLEEMVFETDVEDFVIEDGVFKITTSLEDFNTVQKFFKAKNMELEFADIDYIPTTESVVDEFDKALKLTKMLEAFGEDEDVQKVTVNMIIDEKLQQEVDEFIEKNTFRT